jgi:hypothetical protein
MQFSQQQHEQIVNDLKARGEHELASQHSDWILEASHFNGTPLQEADLERKEAILVLRAKERGIQPR